MAFTGTPTIVQVSARCVKITGLSLGNGAAGTIGLTPGGTGEVDLPASYKPQQEGTPFGTVDLAEGHLVTINSAGAATTPSVRVTYSNPTNPLTFLMTLTNNAAGAATGELEITIQWLA